MRTRFCLRFLCVPLVAVLLGGCTETPTPQTTPAKPAPVAPQPDPKTGKAPKKKKDINQLQGPIDVVP